MSKKLLVSTLVICLSMAITGGHAFASDYSLDEVIVNADRNHEMLSDTEDVHPIPGGYENRVATVGILGNKDVMDTPFQQDNLSQKTIETFGADPSQASTSILVNVPSIRTSSSTLYNDFSIRGQRADAYQFRINGVPGLLSQTNVPMNMIERVEVTSGPGLGITGVQARESAGGVIDLITKRAGKDNKTDYTFSVSGRSTIGNYIDVSRRFGDNDAWGIRINAAYANGDTGIKNEKLKNQNFSINIDHQAERSWSNLFLGYRDTHSKRAQRYFDFSSRALTKIPSAPDSKNNYTFDGQKLGMKTWMAIFNHVQKINDSLKIFANAGYSYNNGYDYLVTASSRMDVLNDTGDLGRNMVNEPFAIRNGYFQGGIEKTFNIGKVKNDMVFAYDKDWYAARWGATARNVYVTGNLYTGDIFHDGYAVNRYKKGYSGKSQFYGWTLADTLSYGKWDITAGVHHHTAAVTSSSHHTTKSDATSPLFAVVYKPNSNWSVFANHAESFDQGVNVGNSYANSGEVLDPAKTKSNEIGVKYTNGNLVTALSYFDMKQDARLERNENGLTYLSMDGETKYKGLEWSLSGKVSPKWTLSGGLMYLDSKYKKNSQRYLNGKTVAGTSDWSGVLTAEYDPNENIDLWGRMVYTGSAPIYTNANRKLKFSSSTVFDLGVRFRSHIKNIPVTYDLTVFNVFNKDYWLPRPTYSYGILGNPRTIAFSAQFHF